MLLTREPEDADREHGQGDDERDLHCPDARIRMRPLTSSNRSRRPLARAEICFVSGVWLDRGPTNEPSAAMAAAISAGVMPSGWGANRSTITSWRYRCPSGYGP